MVLSGLAVGTVLALVMARLIASELFGVTAHDPLTFGLVVGLLALSTLLACYLPARRASRCRSCSRVAAGLKTLRSTGVPQRGRSCVDPLPLLVWRKDA